MSNTGREGDSEGLRKQLGREGDSEGVREQHTEGR